MSISPDNDPVFTSVLHVSLLQIFFLVNIIYFLSFTVDDRIDDIIRGNNVISIVLILLPLIGLNYLGLMYKEKYKKYFQKFSKESEMKRRIANAIIMMFVLLILNGVFIQIIIF
jgi:hypothetical protein